MIRSGQEALDAGAAQGFPVLPIFGLGADAVAAHETVVETLLDTLLAGFVLPTTKTTILQDWIKGRRSEVDDINGRVVAESERHGLRAPVNVAVVTLAHRIESGEVRPGPENLLHSFDDSSTRTIPCDLRTSSRYRCLRSSASSTSGSPRLPNQVSRSG